MTREPFVAKDSRRRRDFSPRKWALVAALLYWAALFVATHLPGSEQARPPPVIPHLDKLIHAAVFAVLSFLLALGISGWWKAGPRLYLGVVGLLTLYATLDELSQGLVSRRYSDWRDWAADVLGAILGVAAFALLERWVTSRSRRLGGTSA
jgi:VanZ family protein